jgi:hypothetical protein
LGGLVVVAYGYLSRELIVRFEAYALCGAACVAIFVFNLQATLPLSDWRSVHWWIVPSVIVSFLGMSEWLKRIAGRPGILLLAGELGQLLVPLSPCRSWRGCITITSGYDFRKRQVAQRAPINKPIRLRRL